MPKGEQDVRRLRGGGVKPALARILTLGPVNAAARSVLRAVAPQTLSRLPVARSSVDYTQGGASVRMHRPDIDQVARDLFAGGGRPTSPADARVLRYVERIAPSLATFLDVGAYSGLFALVAARSNPALKAIAYEIVPENFLLCWTNAIGNDLVSRVEPRLVGIGDSSATIRLPPSLHLASLASSISIGSTFSEGVAIPVRRLDDEAETISEPFAMKIDVEGFEAAVFRGATRVVARSRPDIICEFLYNSDAGADVTAQLKPLGYRFFKSEDDGFREHPAIVPDRGGRDWLLTARNDIDALLAVL